MKEQELDCSKLKKVRHLPIPWYHKFALKASPRLFFKLMFKQMNTRFEDIDCSFELFDNRRVDLFSLKSNRGFMIILDNKFSMWFYQSGDHFEYDGFELGEYENGSVTVFDDVK